MDTLELIWTSPLANGTRDVAEDNPLNRALNALLEGGKPIRAHSMCHIKVPPESEVPDELRWLGVFVQSQGGRVLYFPGFSYERFVAFQGTTRKKSKVFSIDHVSLESTFLKWHMTSCKSDNHFGSPRTLPLGQGRYLWFGLSIADLDVFRPVCEETRVCVPTPSTDSKRRLDSFVSSRKDIEDLWVGLSPGAIDAFDPYFLHIAVIAGPVGFPNYLGRHLGFPKGSPFLETPLPEGSASLPMRLHRMTLGKDVDLQIVLTCLPGELACPATFTAVQES